MPESHKKNSLKIFIFDPLLQTRVMLFSPGLNISENFPELPEPVFLKITLSA